MSDDVKVSEKIVKAKVGKKKGEGKKVYISIDTSMNDVLEYAREGYTAIFADDRDTFLKLPEEVVKELTLPMKDSYALAKEIAAGHNVIKTATEGLQGWKREFNITPGDPSAKLEVLHKDPRYNYQWSNMQRIGRRQGDGFEIDKDPKIRTYDQAESEIGQPVAKTVGGTNASEYVLMRRRKDIGRKFKDAEALRYSSHQTKAEEGFKESVERSGAIATKG